jgi:hypothetical protein
MVNLKIYVITVFKFKLKKISVFLKSKFHLSETWLYDVAYSCVLTINKLLKLFIMIIFQQLWKIKTNIRTTFILEITHSNTPWYAHREYFSICGHDPFTIGIPVLILDDKVFYINQIYA